MHYGGICLEYGKEINAAAAAITLFNKKHDCIERQTCFFHPAIPFNEENRYSRDQATFEILMSLVHEIVDVLVFYRKGTGAKYDLATKIGEEYHFPTFTLADSLNAGTYDPLPNNTGSYTRVRTENHPETYALRTLSYHKPVYLVVGHNVVANQVIPLTFEFSKQYRTPELVRLSRILARQTLRENLANRL